MPLTKQVGEALKDYIRNGRPVCNDDEIFIKSMHLINLIVMELESSTFIQSIEEKEGLKGVAFDGKRFHSLRRAVGKNMITSGVPVTTIVQVLDHNYIFSINKYIALDSVHGM